jgi:serine/threonine-protein kinase
MYDASDAWEATAPVGSFPHGASPFGALDLAGNVWEWTADGYGPYSSDRVTNPRGSSNSEKRVLRGGGWDNFDAGRVRAAIRYGDAPSNRDTYLGFRCARGN